MKVKIKLKKQIKTAKNLKNIKKRPTSVYVFFQQSPKSGPERKYSATDQIQLRENPKQSPRRRAVHKLKPTKSNYFAFRAVKHPHVL